MAEHRYDIVPCTEAHPHMTCNEYDHHLDHLENTSAAQDTDEWSHHCADHPGQTCIQYGVRVARGKTNIEQIRQLYAHYEPTEKLKPNTAVLHIRQLLDYIDGH